MKHFMLRSLMLLSLLCSTWGVGSVWAQLTELEVGGVYHFVNVGHPDKAMGATNPQSVAGVAKDNTNKAQLWYVESKGDNGYALRNLAFGTYLQANGLSTNWTLASTTESNNSWIKLETKNSNNTFKGYTYGNYGYAHLDGSSNIVGWETGATYTQWTITQKKDMSDEDIQNALNFFNSIPTIQNNLNNLFSDKSCTTLKGVFNENNDSYKALPATLQAMVRKVAGKASWEETNYIPSKAKWDAEYAKKYRIQLYEPYNEPEAAAKALGLNAHTNLNNPTGIFANNGDILYVMVEDEIKDGASLYLSYHIGHGELSGYANGFELHQGLNVIPVYNDETNFCINYVVHTFDTSNDQRGNKAKARKLSDYDPIKIHIEGGHINGYWNKVGDKLYAADNNDTWNYLEARATQKTVTVLGKYITLQFPLLDEHTVDTDGKTNKGLATYFNDLVKIEDCINEWDNVMLWERLLLGVLGEQTILKEAKKSPYSDKTTVFEYTGNDGEFESDYSDYYNVHGLSYGIPNSYMYGGWAHCGYNFNTMDGIIQNLPTNAGSHWGPGHEIGHQHQNLLTVNGLTEVTNNLFANVVLWYYGETTSRYNGTEGALSNVLAQFNAEGTDFFSNNIWAQTIMYYKLFLYYHVLGHNPKFYPRLFEMLRQDPMSGGYNQDGSKCLMHFYKKCCLAAGEDLTEFFRAHGFFEVMDNRFVGDYSPSVYNLTQAQIDAAIQEVKKLGYKENIAVLFINDATGETIKSYKGDNLEKYGETTVCAEVGSYSTFNNDEAANYTYSISGSTVTMEGTGGVGFAILNEKGELLGFSDKKTFNISAEAAAAIASGKASIVTFKGDNSSVAATNVMDADNTEAKYALLGELLDNAMTLLDLSDPTGTKVGYYKKEGLADLQEAYNRAKEVYDEERANAYSAVYEMLYQEYADLLNNDYARINITERYAYRLTNKAYSDRSMAVNTENNQMVGIATAESDAQLWYFEPGTTKGTYYLKNKSTQKYPGDASSGTVLSANKSEVDKGKDNGAYAYNLQSMGNGIFALVGSKGLHCSSSQSFNIVGWGADAEASQWTITAVEVDEALEARTKLEEVMSKTEALIAEMADVQMKGYALDMSTCTITSNATETGHETQYLVDGNLETFFHTVWSGTAINENHNIVIDLGEGNSLEQFVLNYTTLPSSSNNVDAPQEIQIYGSNNGSAYTWLGELTGLPNTKGATYTSPTKGTVGTPYRYIRLDVTTATGGKLGSYYYFGIAELGLTNMQPIVHSVLPEYIGARTTIIDACDEFYNATLIYDNNSATVNDLSNATLALSEKYEALLTAYNTPKNAALDAKKQALEALIATTKAHIDACGSATYTPATYDGAADLQTTNASGKFYVSTNADQNTGGGKVDGGGIAALVDNDYNTYFHTRWSGTVVNEPHYFQVDLGEDIVTNKFTFSYKPRNGSPAPTAMTVYGSNDGTTFTDVLATITSGLPAHSSGNTYNSAEITTNKIYRYLRFTVTGSQGPGEKQYGGQYFFGMLEFDLTLIGGSPESYSAEVDDNMGDVTPEMLIETLKETQEAEMSIAYATTEAQLDRASANLQAKIDQLEEAKKGEKSLKKQQLAELIPTATALRDACGSVADNGEVMLNDPEHAGSVNKNMLRDLNSEIANAQGVHDNAASTLDDYTYAITALQNQMDVVTEAKGSDAKATLNAEIEAMATLLAECATNAGSASKQLIEESRTALDDAQGIYDADDTTVYGYSQAKTALNEKYQVLFAAQDSSAKSDLLARIQVMTDSINVCCKSITVENDVYAIEWKFETAGDVDKATLIDAYEALNSATDVYNGDASTVSAYENALESLKAPLATLHGYQGGSYKSMLRSYVDQVAELIAKCEETHGDLTDDMYEDIVQCHKTASAYLTQEFATHDVLVSTIDGAISNIETNYPIWSAAQQSTAKAELLEKIKQMQELIDACTTGEGEAIEYVGDVTEGLLNISREAKEAAQAVVDSPEASTAEFIDAKDKLQGHYNTLEAAKNSKAKADLRAMIAQLAELIEKCRIEETGSVRQESACDVSDAESGKNGNEYYLLVDAGEGETLKNFYFSYQTQTDETLFPYEIEVYGSDNNSEFTDLLATFTTNGENALPSTAGASWTSGDINSVSAYRYLRFNVTVVGKSLPVDDGKDLDTSNGGAQLSNKYKNTLTSESTENISGDFSSVMSNFRLIKIVDVEKTYVYYKGDVTEDQLNKATTVNNNATTLANGSWDSAELTSTKENLQVIYNEILKASQYITVNLTSTSKDRDTLLKGIDDGQTIGTFSAPWATIVPEGVTAYYAKKKYDGEGGTVWLTPVGSNILPANQGVILIGDVGVKSVKFELAEEGEEVADLSENVFSNSAKGPVVMEGNDYILAKVDGQGIGFFNAKPGSKLNQRKAFFRLPAGVNTSKLVLKFGGNTTDIDSTMTDTLPTDDVIYDIYGRRVTEVKKGGIYIKNGKKFFVK